MQQLIGAGPLRRVSATIVSFMFVFFHFSLSLASAATFTDFSLDRATLVHNKQKVNADTLSAKGSFRFAGSANPMDEVVSFSIGPFLQTIPANTFTQKNLPNKQAWNLRGARGGVTRFTFVKSGDQWEFTVSATGLSLSFTAENAFQMTLQIGDDHGANSTFFAIYDATERIQAKFPGKRAMDLDSDGLTDHAEAGVGTNPIDSDTDGDGIEDGAEVLAGEDPLVPENIPPVVTITSPTDGATFIEGANLLVAAMATDNGEVASVRFEVNGASVATDTTAPFSANVEVLFGIPSFVLTAMAFDKAGNTATDSVTVNVAPSSFTTVNGRVVDEASFGLVGIAVQTLGRSGVTEADGSFSIPNVSATDGDIVAFARGTVAEQVLLGHSQRAAPTPGGATNVGDIELDMTLLFSASFDAVGALGSALESAVLGNQAPSSVFFPLTENSNQLVRDGLALGVQLGEGIDALDMLADGSLIFSVDFGTRGTPGSAVAQAAASGLRPSHIYRSTGNSTNELFISGADLGILAFAATSLDALALLPDGSVLFSVQPGGRGVAGSAIEASPAGTRALNIYRSFLNGTNELFRSADELGLVSGDLDGLVWVTDGMLLFSVALGTQGVPGSAVAAAAPETLDADVFLTASNGANERLYEQAVLGVVSGGVDALALTSAGMSAP